MLNQVQIEVLVPGTVALPISVRTLGIVDSSYLYDPPDPTNEQTQNYLTRIHLSKSDLVGSTISGFTDVIEVSPRFEYKMIKPTDFGISDTSMHPGLSDWERIQLLCHDSAVDALIILKYFDIYDPLFVGLDPGEGEGSGYYISVRNSWRIYDPSEMEIIDEYTNTDSTYSYSEDDFFEFLLGVASNRKTELTEACFWSGQKYAFRITPLWEEVTRNYYTWPGELSNRAKQFATKGDWLSAAWLWNQETGNEKVKTAARACFNMALASEVEDKLELALYWARRSDTLVPNRIVTLDYIELLLDRLKERKELDQQMGNQ
jgi:hypothetical protein